LVRDDPAVDEQLAAPHAPRLLAGQSRGEALGAHGALRAERLRPRDVPDVLREEQVDERGRAIAAARVDPPEVFGVLGGLEDGEHLGAPVRTGKSVSYGRFGGRRVGWSVRDGTVRGSGKRPEMQEGRRGAPAAWVSRLRWLALRARPRGAAGAGACG